MVQFLSEVIKYFFEHIAEWALVGVTSLSVFVSGVLGFLAYWNGRKAGFIAQEASAREQHRICLEKHRRVAERREKTALEMLMTLNAVSDYIDTLPWHDRQISKDAFKALPSIYTKTYSKLDLYSSQNSEPGLREWLEQVIINLLRIAHAHDSAPDLARLPIKDTREAILEWYRYELKSTDLDFNSIRWPSRADIL